MKKLLDVNLWLALTLPSHPHHQIARRWYEETPLDPGDLVFCRAAQISFLRLVTRTAVMANCGSVPLTNNEAVDFLSSVFSDPAVSDGLELPSTRSLWLELARSNQPSPNLWMDAYLAASALSLGAEMVTFDKGFRTYQSQGLTLKLLRG